MRRVKSVCFIAASVLSTASFGTLTAMAATQNQTQSLYTTQAQEVDTSSGAAATQDETSTLAAQQSETTQKQTATQPVVNNNQQNAGITQDHTINNSDATKDTTTSTTTSCDVSGNNCTAPTNTTVGTDSHSHPATFSQTQSDNATSKTTKTVTDTSAQITATTNTTSTQSGNVDTSGKVTLSQTDTSVIIGKQAQTAQQQTITGPAQTHTQSQSISAPLDDSYLLPLRSSFPSTEVVGYAVFDTSGNLLSDSYGIFPSIDNNAMKLHRAFLPNTPTQVVIAAVNSFGQIVPNTQSTQLYLRSNNYNGVFLNPQTIQTIYAVQIPEGSMGIMVGYVNPTPNTQFDVLDAGTVNPNARPAPQRPTVIATQQSQTASVPASSTPMTNSQATDTSLAADTTATQKQTTVVKADAPATAFTPIQQSSALTQQSDASQTQTVVTKDQTKVGESESSTVTTAQDTSNQSASSAAITVQATQSESLAGPSQDASKLSQTQSVTAVGTIMNVTLTQSHPTDAAGVTLSQFIGVTISAATATSWNTLINVTYQGTEKQYTLNTIGPVTFNESQTAGPTSSTPVSDTASIDYMVGSTAYHIPISG